ncbi:head-tail connector protein [Gordonia phage Pleakley]|uniref:Head-to-tail connector protein n=1 Tax=Gordonia phage Pleakley TaxID=2283246 RepID=A0A345M6F7_9CAUD|nr:head-tail connector protein [Gordonia phage Pleakley]AXH49765.1 hypothetical protein SEA_FURY_39 [Gordonia phage Fury]AXH66078.1 hypothetical protein SEA_PLEAKLEY_39 [Gordonia phage Pleakley]
MARKLTTYVWLRDPKSDEMNSFGPDDKLPGWAEKLLEGKDHLFDGKAPEYNEVDQDLPRDRKTDVDYVAGGPAVGKEPAASEQGQTELTNDEGDDGDDEDETDEQPKGNASREAWALFATDNGVPVTDEMGRDDIKAAAREAGVIE